MKSYQVLINSAILLLTTTGVNAIELNQNEFLIRAHGTVVIPPCHINHDTTIDIDFGALGIKKSMNTPPQISTWIPISCDDTETNYLIQIRGKTLPGRSDQTLETDMDGLGIEFSQSGKVIPLNTSFPPDQDSGLLLETKLIFTDEFHEKNGDFHASATLTTLYV